MVGGGGALRNNTRDWISSFSRNLGTTASIMVKLWALKDDHALVLQLEFDNINVEMDAKVITYMLTLC